MAIKGYNPAHIEPDFAMDPKTYLSLPQACYMKTVIYPTPPAQGGKARRRGHNLPKPPVSFLTIRPKVGIGAFLLQRAEDDRSIVVVAAHMDDWFGPDSFAQAARQVAGLLGKRSGLVEPFFVAANAHYANAIDEVLFTMAQEGLTFKGYGIEDGGRALGLDLTSGAILAEGKCKGLARKRFARCVEREVKKHRLQAENRTELSSAFTAGLFLGGRPRTQREETIPMPLMRLNLTDTKSVRTLVRLRKTGPSV